MVFEINCDTVKLQKYNVIFWRHKKFSFSSPSP